MPESPHSGSGVSLPSTPDVTVVVPTRNRCALLRHLLESLSAQVFPCPRFEVLVMDNASTDGTAQMVEEYSRSSGFLLRHVPQNNAGPSQSRHNGLKMARGEFVAFIDSDCVATPTWLAEGTKAFGSGIGLVQGRTCPNPHQRRYLLERTVTVDHEGPLYETCNVFYRHPVAVEAGGFAPEFDFYGEDTDLAWRVKRLGYSSTFAPEALVYHHVFPISVWAWLADVRHARKWPQTVRTVPELREFLYLRYFLTRSTAAFDLALIGLVLSLVVNWSWAALTAPYLITRYRDSGRFGGPMIRTARVLFGIPRALLLLAFLLYGSARHRCPVL